MATGTSSSNDNGSFSSLGIQNTAINEGTDVKLSDQQKVLVGSVLDLFEGKPTLKHLSLWHHTAIFEDALTVAYGYDKFAAQWYGLPAIFHPIKMQSHTVTSAGNPIEFKLVNQYTVRGIHTTQTIESVVKIFYGDDGKIDKVEDRWNGTLPEGGVSQVRFLPFETARRLVGCGVDWGWWTFCTLSRSWPFLAFRKLNAVTVPVLVKVPKTEEEDMQMKTEREKEA